ncbi:MAG: pyridoxal phosphate-dependent aminotransferase [Oscillospiraceae bacterium]|jgi:cystathionine beta-lyase|nr:pyridoxal phosphate-dependent aminotransferase [Oscillospiraceae bacterium]
MAINFDEIIDRNHTQSFKYDTARESGMGFNAIPLWIADMDFRVPDSVTAALVKRTQHGIYGYSTIDDNYFDAVRSWFAKRHSWNVEPHWLVTTPGILPAVAAAVSALTKPNEAVLVHTPAYDRFNITVEKNNRRLIKSALILKDGRYEIDFDDFEKKITKNSVKLYILCSPHNPIGRVWTLEELTQIGGICLKHGVKIISDEIFCDFVHAPNKHTVFAGIKQEFADITVTCTAPTKTFNMSGLAISNIFIADDDIRDDFNDKLLANGIMGGGILPMLACRAAYENGAEWLDELLVYLAGNIAFVRNFLRDNLSNVKLIEPEGTYLLWLDFREFGLWANELKAFTAYDAGVILSSEAGAEGFLRVNAACPRSVLEKAMTKLAKAANAR